RRDEGAGSAGGGRENHRVRYRRPRGAEAGPDRRDSTAQPLDGAWTRGRRGGSRHAVTRGRLSGRGGEGIMRKAIAVGRKEFRQIARDRRSLLVLLFVPAFFLLLYGYALNFDVQHIHLAIEDDDQT